MRKRVVLIGMLALLASFATVAQDAPPEAPAAEGPVGVLVEVSAEDEKTLRGEYYVPDGGGNGAAVLLLHELYTTRSSWGAVIEHLLARGFRVLAVDLRGWGATRGAINWRLAPDDTQVWLDWLREQPGVRGAALFTMGSSMGANLALRGCAEAETCAGVVAISPGLNYFGVRTAAAIESGVPVLIAYADRDYRPARDVPRMRELEGAAVTVIARTGREHGMDLLDASPELAPELIAWMAARIP